MVIVSRKHSYGICRIGTRIHMLITGTNAYKDGLLYTLACSIVDISMTIYYRAYKYNAQQQI